MIFVADTNTLISAILKPTGVCMIALTTCYEKGLLLFSKETKLELHSVIAREKFNRYVDLSTSIERMHGILSHSKIIEIKNSEKIECRDSSDTKFLSLAIESNANCITSGGYSFERTSPFPRHCYS